MEEKQKIQVLNQPEATRAARAAKAILEYPFGAIPNAVRNDIGGLEALLNGILAGKLAIVDASTLPREEQEEE